jgi:hypothetical protein
MKSSAPQNWSPRRRGARLLTWCSWGLSNPLPRLFVWASRDRCLASSCEDDRLPSMLQRRFLFIIWMLASGCALDSGDDDGSSKPEALSPGPDFPSLGGGPNSGGSLGSGASPGNGGAVPGAGGGDWEVPGSGGRPAGAAGGSVGVGSGGLDAGAGGFPSAGGSSSSGGASSGSGGFPEMGGEGGRPWD